MSGDRLQELEEGFLEGNLSPAEEAELRQLVAAHKGHHLSHYFQWTEESESYELPDMRQKLRLEDKPILFRRQNLFKIAATLLLMLTTTFIFRPELFKAQSTDSFSREEIDKSYEATIKTLTAMATFLNESLPQAEEGLNISAPFKELNSLDNTETQEQ
ncbi:MAG: hypothetical protein Roseis2KO_39590 [Roseivirga sp.]